MLVFCQCGSDRVDVTNWNVNHARLHCFSCGRESWLDGFTISPFDPAALLGAANRGPSEEASEATAGRRAENSGSEKAIRMTAKDALDAANDAEPGERLHRYEMICGPPEGSVKLE